MSFRDREMHVISALGAVVLAAGLAVPTLWFAKPKAADAKPLLEEMEAIDASLAVKKRPAKQPQKKIEEKPKQPKEEGVSRDEKKVVEDKTCKKDRECGDGEVCRKGKCEREKVAKAEEPGTGPVTAIDAVTGDKPTTAVGDFNDNDRGWAEETKGHPFFQGIARDFVENFEYPKILEGENAAGCIHLLADGTIQKYKVDPKSGVDTLDDAVERALKKMKQLRAQNPEPPPIELLKQATTRWICFNTGKLQRAE